jgi:cytochrome c oxidase assembly factor CtaG
VRRRAAAYLGGVAALVLALALPGSSLESHVVAHALIAVVAAPLLVLAGPLALVLGPLPPERRRRALALLRRPPLVWLAVPAVTWCAFVAAHWTALIVAARADPGGLAHVGVHVMLLVAALLFWLPVLGRGPVPRPVRGPAASLYLFLAVPATDLTVVWLMARGDTGAAGAMLVAMLPLGAAALLVSWRWIVREERLARMSEAAR